MALSTIYTEICYAHILWIRPIDCINHDRNYSTLTNKEILIEFGWEHLLCVGKHEWPFVPSDLVWKPLWLLQSLSRESTEAQDSHSMQW